MPDILVSIPVELTQSMIIRAGVIDDEARALELATELHEVVAEVTKLYRVYKSRIVKFRDDDELAKLDPSHAPDDELVVLEEARVPNALEVADFVLAVWRQALGKCSTDDDVDEGEWISVLLAALCDEDLYLRWSTLCEVITGSDIGTSLLKGNVN
jgi:hypothetical protein